MTVLEDPPAQRGGFAAALANDCCTARGLTPVAVPAAGGGGVPLSFARGSRLWLLLVGCGVALLPWIVVLAVTLPRAVTAPHWGAAWVGMDAFEAVGLIGTGVLAARRDHRQSLAAAVTGALLAVDAWFDILTSAPGAGLLTAVAVAVCLELPLAVLCARLALRTMPRGPGGAPAG